MEILKGLYHPDKLDEQSFIENFTIRIKEFRLIIDNLTQQKKKPLQHFLITGKRGMGKSTLLRRIHIEAFKSPLNKKMLVVRLGSEQYRLSRLFKLWEMVIEHLGDDAPELLLQKKELEQSKQYEESLVFIINDYLAKINKTLLLLIDNFDQFIEKIPEKDQHALREALMLYPIQLIGNTVFYNEHFISYTHPFYDFFKPIRLGNLNKTESEEFIKHRAISEGIDNFEEIFKTQKGKITALRILSGGVPRTLLILLSIVSKESTGNAVEYLYEMIEQVTPLYQDRMKALSSQQQEIMHSLAMRWDKTPVKELAAEMRIPSKSISAQLIQLEKSGYIKKVDIPGRNHYYEIDERFFNIWLLMSEAAPYDTKRVIWLTKWLDAFYSSAELKGFARFCQTDLKKINPKNRFLLIQALSESEKLERSYKNQLIKETVEELKDKMSEVTIWADKYNKRLTEEEISIKEVIIKSIVEKDFEKVFKNLNALKNIDKPIALSIQALLYLIMKDIDNAEKYYLLAIENGSRAAIFWLGNLYESVKKNIALAEKYYLIGLEKGDPYAMSRLGYLYETEHNDILLAEKYYLMAVEKGVPHAMFRLGYLYETEQNDITLAEKYYLMAVEKGNSDAMSRLGYLYYIEKNDIVLAEKYYLMAVEKGDSYAMSRLGYLYYIEKNDMALAEKYYLMAVEEDDSDAMFALGYLYQAEQNDMALAEKYYRMGAEKGDAFSEGSLANLYFETNKISQKKEALKLSAHAVESTQKTDITLLVVYAGILLWNEEIKDAHEIMTDILTGPLHTDENMSSISEAFQYFLVFKQNQLVYKLFSSNAEWIDRYKPVYYALLHEMKDEYLKDYLKMTEELEEPVTSILEFVKNEQKRLGL